MNAAVALALLPLAGCTAVSTALGLIPPRSATTPVIRARDGSSVSLTIVACPRTVAGGQAVHDVLTMLVNSGEIVVAEAGGNARLTIDACPGGVPPPDAVQRRRRE